MFEMLGLALIITFLIIVVAALSVSFVLLPFLIVEAMMEADNERKSSESLDD